MITQYLKKQVLTGKDVAAIMMAILAAEPEIEQEKEHFWCIGLDVKNRIKYIDLVSLGTLTSSLIHPRETFRMAIMQGCASIVVAHNHPSGDTTPSRDDIAVTDRLCSAGEILGVKMLDHIIIGNEGGYYSMLEHGHITGGK